MYEKDDDNFRAYEGGDEKKGKYDDQVNGFSVNEKLLEQGGFASFSQRTCTDLLFLVVFWIGMGAMVYFGVDGLMKGNPAKLMAPLDGDNKFCGIDQGYEEYDKLFIPLANANLFSLFDGSVCVKYCPMKDDSTECKETEKHSKCPQAQYDTADTVGIGYCLPTDLANLPPDAMAGLNTIKQSFMQSGSAQYVIDVEKAYKTVAICSLLSFVICLLYVKLMSAFAEIIAWLCVVLIQIGLFALAGAGWYAKQLVEENYEKLEDPTKSQTDDYNYQIYCCWGAIILFALLGLIFLISVCCGFTHLKLAIDVIDASADFLDENTRIYLVPLFFFFCSFVSIIIWGICVIGVYSEGKIEPDPVMPQVKKVEITDVQKYQLLYLLFAILWLCAWFEYANSFVVMHSAVQYYFGYKLNQNTNVVENINEVHVAESFRCAFLKHPGSIAVGAFIIALIRFIRIVFVYFCQQIQKQSGENPVVKLALKCANCYLWCLEKICDYINESAFAYMAVSGDSFCTSAWNGFLLNLKHLVKFTFANSIAKMFVALGKGAIVLANMLLAYEAMDFFGSIDQVSSVWGPLFVVGLVTFAAASIFLGLLDETVMGMMTSLAIDMDINNGQHIYGPQTFHDSLDKVQKKDSFETSKVASQNPIE